MRKLLFGLFIIMLSCSKKVTHNLHLIEEDENSTTMNIEEESSEKLIIFHRWHCNYPVEVFETSEEIVNEIAIEYEYNSILSSKNIGIYAMEPNTVNSHVDFAKYLETNLNTKVNYFREDDGTPQILWDFPAPKGLNKENVKDIIAITKFRRYHVINANEWNKGDYIILFSDKMNFRIEGLTIESFIFDRYEDAQIGALKLLFRASDHHSSKIDEYKTKTEQFSNLMQRLKYFKFNANYLIFESNINIDNVDSFNEEELEEIKSEIERIWLLIGHTPYTIEEL